jgi:hypothetical protein
MKIAIRGHVRNAFSTNDLYRLLKELSIKYPIEIYIHTWNKKQNNISWRHVENDDTVVNTSLLKSYFRDVFEYVNEIIIEDDSDIELNGNLSGTMASTRTNILGWKRYIYGQYTVLQSVYEQSNEDDFVLNTRFDLFTNSYVFPYDEILCFIEKNYTTGHKTNTFMREGFYCGVDNIIIGSAKTNYMLMKHIHTNLDNIILENKTIKNPEFFIPITNNSIQV